MKKMLAIILSIGMALSVSACGGVDKENAKSNDATAEKTSSSQATSGKEVVIKYPTYRVGTHLSAGSEKIFIDGFNEMYRGKYRVEVEELPSDGAYVEKMKVLASSKALPDVVEGKDGIYELAVRNGQAIDLTEMLSADAQFKEEIGSDAIAANTKDGKLYSISNGNQLIGYFYNKEHFEKAGIQPAKTWEEFMSNLDALKVAGFTPISMMTGDNCWTTNLLLASMIGTANDPGNEFMKTKYPESYETPEVKASLEMVQKILKNYTTKDALGGKYDISANHFLQGKTSIICNGPWMTADFSDPAKAVEGLNDNIGVALYPNDGIFAQYEIGYMICTDDKAKQEAAFQFIKYKTNAAAQLVMLEEHGTIPLTGNVALSDDYKADNPLVAQIIELSADAKYKFNTIDNISYASVIEAMSKSYPSLTMDDLTIEDMSKLMTEAAAKNK